jgi:hypothetical protein
MHFQTRRSAVLLVGLVLVLAHCGDANRADRLLPVGEASSASGDALIGGEYTFDQPEVGRTARGCTATLISPSTVLTAAHCVDYKGVARGGATNERFFTDYPDGSRSEAVDEIVVFAKTLGKDDIALFHLALPITDVTPAPLAARSPREGDDVTVFGYGCGNHGAKTDAQTGKKQRKRYRWDGGERDVCPGDSGGPHMFTGGGIYEVTSGYHNYDAVAGLLRDDHDITADVVKNRDRILGYIAAWRYTPCGNVAEAGACDGDALLTCDATTGLTRRNCSVEAGDALHCGLDATYQRNECTACVVTDKRATYLRSYCVGSAVYFDTWTDNCGHDWNENAPSSDATCARCSDPNGNHANCL